MRVLLAGASGVIGRRLVAQLIEAGHEVIGVTRRAGSLAGTDAREHVADVSDRAEFLRSLHGIEADAVVNQLTALKKAPLFYRDMRETNRLRLEGTSTLVAAARRVGATKMVSASIFYGYGFSSHDMDLLDETAPFGEPDGRNDVVQASLRGLEQQTRAFGGIALRYGLLYAPGVTRVSPVPRTWNGRLPMLHISDAASAVVLALARGKAGRAYNIADDHPASYREREIAVARAAGVRPPMELPESVLRAAAPFGSQLSTRTRIRMSMKKARRELGWKPQYASLAEGLAAQERAAS
jgi:nucleoside-diphosphate-sugar epimerase